jgi:CRISPR/Cas system CSM-associated protein Csm3 (group 7 of RAMP superfamily)
MLKKIINSARIEMEIIPIDPLLIKSGQASVSGVDMAFVRTYRSSEKDEPFIPGSSLKGVIRSYAEKICRSLKDSPVPVCLPYLDPKDKAEKGEERQYSCGLLFEKFKKDKNLKTVPTPDCLQSFMSGLPFVWFALFYRSACHIRCLFDGKL